MIGKTISHYKILEKLCQQNSGQTCEREILSLIKNIINYSSRWEVILAP